MSTWRDREARAAASRPLSLLPNRDGFKFVGVKADGETVKCEVKLLENGSHAVGGEATFSELIGWRYA